MRAGQLSAAAKPLRLVGSQPALLAHALPFLRLCHVQAVGSNSFCGDRWRRPLSTRPTPHSDAVRPRQVHAAEPSIAQPSSSVVGDAPTLRAASSANNEVPAPTAADSAASSSSAPAAAPTGRFVPTTTALDGVITAQDRDAITAALAPMANFGPLRKRAEIDHFIGSNLLQSVVSKLRRTLVAKPALLFKGEDALQRFHEFVSAAAAAVREEQRAAAAAGGAAAADDEFDSDAATSSGSDGEDGLDGVEGGSELAAAAAASEIAEGQRDAAELLAGLKDVSSSSSAAKTLEPMPPADNEAAEEAALTAALTADAEKRSAAPVGGRRGRDRDRTVMDIPSGWHARAGFYQHHALPLLGIVAEAHFAEQVSAARLMRRSADLSSPHMWYPRARAIKRRIIFHAGPTNSGKTYRALQALKNAHSGEYWL